MTPVTITLEGVPVGKGRPRMTRAGNIYTPDKTRSYEYALQQVAKVAMIGRTMFDGPVAVTLTAIFPIPANWSRQKRNDAIANLIKPTVKPDIDNVLKTLDALNGIVWKDDKQIVSGHIAKVYGPSALVAITVQPA